MKSNPIEIFEKEVLVELKFPLKEIPLEFPKRNSPQKEISLAECHVVYTAKKKGQRCGE